MYLLIFLYSQVVLYFFTLYLFSICRITMKKWLLHFGEDLIK